MKSYRVLVWRELLAQKVTSILILIAVILSTITTTVIGQSIGILNAMREQQAISLNGNKYATFLQLSEDQLSVLKGDSRLSFVGPSINMGTMELNSQLSLGLVEYMDESLSAYPTISQIMDGRLPEQAMEIALPEDALKFLGFQGEIGDTISLPMSKVLRHSIAPSFDYTADFILTGITQSNYLTYINGGITGIAGAGTASQLLPAEYLYYNVDFRTSDKKSFQETVNELAQAIQLNENDTSYNQVYLSTMSIFYDGTTGKTGIGFSLMALAGVMVGFLILLAAGLVIYNILKISVAKRIKEYGILRAIGSEKGQLYSIVTLQILLLCLIGIPIGVLVGFLTTKGIVTAATAIVSPSVFMVESTSELRNLISANSSANLLLFVVSAAITLAFAFIAAIPAAHYVAKVSPTVAIAGRNTKIKRRNRKARKIRNFEAHYARLNLKRNRSRTAITILSLVMSIAVFITLQGFTSLLNAASGMEDKHLGDYSITNETIGFSADELYQIQQNEMVQSATTVKFSLYMPDADNRVTDIPGGFDLQPGETLQMAGLNDEYWDYFMGDRISQEDLEILKSGNACVVRNPLPISFNGEELARTVYQAGDVIQIAGKEIRVLSALDGYAGYIGVGNSSFTNGIQIIVSDAVYTELTGKSAYNEIAPVLKEGVERNEFDKVVDSLCRDIPGTTYISYSMSTT